MKKVKIFPVPCFCNGIKAIAEYFSVQSVKDDLFSYVQFKYSLFDKDGVQCGEGSFELNGEDSYRLWDASAVNAYEIVGEGLGLEFEPVVGSRFFEG